MPGIVVKINPATIVMTGLEFRQYGNYYLDAAEFLLGKDIDNWFDPLPYQLVCQSLELHLKSFIWLVDQNSRKTIKNKYGHDIEKLWHHSKERGIYRYCKPTPARDKAIALVGPYYKNRKFAYLDLSMSWNGIPHLREHPKAKRIILRLCKQLRKSLKNPILNAS